MSRPATSRLKVNPPLGRMPALQFCAPGELRVDPAYQRGLAETNSVSLIRKIAMFWNWDLCQPLVVARRAGGELFVIDGQHRLEAARLRGDIVQLPCVVIDYTSVADEAASFVHLNQQRKPLTKLDLFRAAVASEDPQATAITAALADAGLTLAPHNNYTAWKPGMVSHIGGIERVWSRQGAEVASRALIALGQGFSGQIQRYCGTLYRGIAQVCADERRAHGHFKGARFEQFLAMLSRRDQVAWVGEINRYFAANPDMFRAESADAVFRQEWRSETTGVAPPAPSTITTRNAGEPITARKGEGFGLGVGDWKGDQEWAWCEQCDARRVRSQVSACASRHCKLKVAA